MNLNLKTPDDFKAIARQDVLRRSAQSWKQVRSDRYKQEGWKSCFGTTPEVASWIWNKLEETHRQPANGKPKHLLWCFVLLKVYSPNQRSHCAMVGGPDPETFRKYSWLYIEAVHDLYEHVINFDKLFFHLYACFGIMRKMKRCNGPSRN